MRKLTIIVSCTSRKSVPPEPHLQARSLPTGGARERAAAWIMRLRSAPSSHPLFRLYQGETWQATGRLAHVASKAGFTPTMLVASAGLGLRPVTAEAPSYAATFSRANLDSVVATDAEAADWWNLLQANTRTISTEDLHGPVLIVTSEAYSRALVGDLVRLGERGSPVLLVGGHQEVPGVTRLPADRGLRPVLGGTTTSLNVRTAAAWLERLDRPQLISHDALASWATWTAANRAPERWSRTHQTDQQVVDQVAALLRRDPALSTTRALRSLRDAGYACEQSRFRALFTLAKAESA